jgi:uncharacterized Fe-S cluster-containing MiaB family protein
MRSPDTTSFLKYVLSTITSSAFPEVVVFHSDGSFFDSKSKSSKSNRLHLRELSQAERMEEVSLHCKRLEALREVYKVQGFHWCCA